MPRATHCWGSGGGAKRIGFMTRLHSFPSRIWLLSFFFCLCVGRILCHHVHSVTLSLFLIKWHKTVRWNSGSNLDLHTAKRLKGLWHIRGLMMRKNEGTWYCGTGDGRLIQPSEELCGHLEVRTRHHH